MVSGCGTFAGVAQRIFRADGITSPKEVFISVGKDANQGYPVAVDVVVVGSQDVLSTISRLKAAEWFAGRKDFQRMHTGVLYVHSWEVVPGSDIRRTGLQKFDGVASGTLVFANYLGEGAFSADVSGYAVIHLYLGADDFSATQLPRK